MIFVVAEAGVNHNGDYRTALELCDAARLSGANAVKFQCFSSQKLWGDDRIKHLEFDYSQFEGVASYCDGLGIEFMCTPFDVGAVEFLNPLVKRMKISSGCIAKHDLLFAVARTKLPFILSTGMSNARDIGGALAILSGIEVDKKEVLEKNGTLLHCTSAYPCPPEDVNLLAMKSLEAFGLPVGFSDHTENGACAIAAAALGATVIEKHLTLSRSQAGPDHQSSIEPASFTMMVQAIRTVEKALGDGIKRVMPGEVELRKAWRSLV